MKATAAQLAAFERLWAVYPRKGEHNPKAPARAAFLRLLAGGEDAEALVEAARAFADLCRAKRTEAKFIPHARRWLAGREFEDYLAGSEASAAAARPNPEHPLFELAAEIGADTWCSWIAPIVVVPEGAVVHVLCPTRFSHDTVKRQWGPLIEQTLDAVVSWGVQERRAP